MKENIKKEKQAPRTRKRTITKIEAVKKEPPKLKVCGYCRVSTVDQSSSIENQRQHFLDVISKHENWSFVDIYYEDGVTGTKKELRPELHRLIEDCKNKKINLILCKSISRFARNTTDFLELVRLLTGMGVDLYFEKEQIHTGTRESEFLLTLLALMAEEESRSISENEKWSIRKRFQNGTYRSNKAPYGYRLENGTFVVNPEEAVIVREIFDSILAGKGGPLIARELNERQIPTEWTASRIKLIVKNEAYMGDLLMQKTFHDQQFRRHFNYGEEPQYYYEDHHEPIVSREVFQRAQEAIQQRGYEKGNFPPEDKRPRNNPHQNRYVFTGRLICGHCGSVMRRQVKKRKNGDKIYWCCKKHLEDPDSCPQKSILEEDIQHAFLTMLNKVNYARDLIIGAYLEDLREYEKKERLWMEEDLKRRLNDNIDQRHRLMLLIQKGCIDPIVQKEKEIRLKQEAVQIHRERSDLRENNGLIGETLRFQKYLVEGQSSTDNTTENRITNSTTSNSTTSNSTTEEAFDTFVDKVIILDRNCFEFHLKCGLVFTEDACE